MQRSKEVSHSLKQKNSFKDHIYDASIEFHLQHGKNTMYNKDLQVGNVILTDCILEKFSEVKGAKLMKVGFKLLGTGFINEGIPMSLEVWSIMASPSK